MADSSSRRGVLIGLGALVIVAGLVAAVALWSIGGDRRSDAVAGLARAPVGCDTTLDFVETGEYFVFIERAGRLDGVRGDCDVEGAYDVGAGTPDVDITIVDPDGEPVDLDRTVTDLDYDEAGFVGTAAFTIDITETNDHVVRVESPDSEVFVVAIGRDPNDGVAVLRGAAAALGMLGLLLGGGLILLGARRSTATVAAAAMGARCGWTADAVRAGPDAAGPAGVRPARRSAAVRPAAAPAVPGQPPQYGQPPQPQQVPGQPPQYGQPQQRPAGSGSAAAVRPAATAAAVRQAPPPQPAAARAGRRTTVASGPARVGTGSAGARGAAESGDRCPAGRLGTSGSENTAVPADTAPPDEDVLGSTSRRTRVGCSTHRGASRPTTTTTTELRRAAPDHAGEPLSSGASP